MPNVTSIVHFQVTQFSSRHFQKQDGDIRHYHQLIHSRTNGDAQDDNVDQDNNKEDSSYQQES